MINLDITIYILSSNFFLQVSEASVNRNRSTIIVPAGSSGEEGWEAFRNVLLEINNEASRLYVLPNHPNQVQETIPFFDIFMKSQMTSSLNSCHCIWQQHLEPPERLPGLSDDVGAGFIAGHGSQSASGPEVDVERLVDLPPQEEISGMGMSKVIRADQKRFFFDLGSNNRGHYLRISEVSYYLSVTSCYLKPVRTQGLCSYDLSNCRLLELIVRR